MMRRLMICLIGLALFGVGNVARADWDEFWDRVRIDWLRMNCWPEPFVHADRQAVHTPLIAMTHAGWQLQNTLSDHFFDAETGSLTQAGELKVRWIVTQAPVSRRTVFVLRGLDPEATQLRLDAVEEVVHHYTLHGTPPQVLVTDRIPAGSSGDYLDQVGRELRQSIPPPRLPERESTTGGR